MSGEWKCLTPSWANTSSELKMTGKSHWGFFVGILGKETFAAQLTMLQTITGLRKLSEGAVLDIGSPMILETDAQP